MSLVIDWLQYVALVIKNNTRKLLLFSTNRMGRGRKHKNEISLKNSFQTKQNLKIKSFIFL